ncbi:monooxygenase [Acrocarpospora pleiomorpha]|uniref:Monooxygenase n=1 Tax=Acrocarpospora pleiomorpha TaxID=90975 RepID=A0A5M3XFI1_9ACTN|nr:NAD(P)/FAD-dependent oxidoreductase [Acrocarpospora pleiomorpha]GES20024.1 monooxygenase [Acrocarpospora pleiomorpha]
MADIDVDVEALREKYREERDKRLRTAGTDQYNFAEGRYAHFDDDPHAAPPAFREPLHEELDVLVIGGGFGGLQAAATMRSAGVHDVRILDVAADFGGTWYWNRYPGIRCDVESYIYLPYLEETGFIPSERYVTGAEIFRYCQKLGHHFGLYERALFQTKVTGLEWDEDAARWTVSTSRGDRLRPRFVVTQSGIFNRPQLPGIPGIETFQGHMFHSARWDFAYTGGDSTGGLDRLHDKRVGVIGTGATGLQMVPKLAEGAQHLTVFQRTPTGVGVRDNGPTDLEWFKSLPAGWQKAREDSFNRLANMENVDCPVDDGWARFFRDQVEAIERLPEAERTPEAIGSATEAADYAWGEMLRARVDTIVHDPGKAELLKAYYRTLCKRPGFSDDYLPAFDQANVSLVDASGGIERITERGIVVDGVEHELDCVIFATGFELGTTWCHQAGYDVVSRGGARLSEKWADGIRTFHGLFSHGFPNSFFMGLTQTGTTISVPHMLQEQVNHITHIVRHCLDQGVTRVEATVEAEREWQEVIAAKTALRRPFQEACTPGYFNAEGRPEDMRSAIGSGMYFPSTEFFAMLADWRDSGDFAGLKLS